MINIVSYGDKQFPMDFYLDDPIGSSLSQGRFYEEGFLTYIKQNFPNQRVILDIGSNVGNHAVFFRNFLKNEGVYCFEPVPLNFEKLVKNTDGMDIVSFNFALSDKLGVSRIFNSQPSNKGGYTLEDTKFPNHNPLDCGIDCITIPLDLINIANISMIKIDVENHELHVLEGARKTIVRNKPIIFIENLYHGHPEVCPVGKFDNFFSSINYSLKESNILGGFMDAYIPNNL